ncbi:LON peptidase N-terminal domain and RING finger protein 1-like [Rhopilema esculentum]|eukprot:gene127-9740_t
MKDGYNTAKVRWLKDAAVTDNDLEMLSKLNSDVYAEMKTFVLEFLKRQNQSVLASQIQFPALENDKIGSRDGPSWVWWLIDCFIEATEHKIEFISSESLEERLNIIRSQLSMSC